MYSSSETNQNSRSSESRPFTRVPIVVLAAIKKSCNVPNDRAQETQKKTAIVICSKQHLQARKRLLQFTAKADFFTTNCQSRLTHQDQPIPQPQQGGRLSYIDNCGFSSSPSSVYLPRHAWQRQSSSDLPEKFRRTNEVNAKRLQQIFEILFTMKIEHTSSEMTVRVLRSNKHVTVIVHGT